MSWRYLSMLFVVIVCLGLAVRLWRIETIPYGVFSDEASIGYNAYSIFKTGTDQYGTRFPIFFKAFGEYKSPIQIYSTVPLVALFGLNEFTTRLPSVVYGVFSLGVLYLLVTELFREDKHKHVLAILSMFFLAISPWAIHTSRISLEGFMPFVFFTILGVYTLLKAQQTSALLPFSILAFVGALYSYFPARLFIPLFGIGLVAIYHTFFRSHIKETVISLLMLIILLFPMIHAAFSPTGLTRWQQVNIFTNPPKNETVIHHIVRNYALHFSVDFLFIKGDIDMPGQFITRHSVRNIGELYLFQLPLIIFGMYAVIKRKIKSVLSSFCGCFSILSAACLRWIPVRRQHDR